MTIAAASRMAAPTNAASAPLTNACSGLVGGTQSGVGSESLPLAEPKIVTRTARPTEAPTCCETLTSPDAAPASLRLDRVQTGRGQRHERRPVAEAEQHERSEHAQVAARSGELGQPDHAQEREAHADQQDGALAEPLDEHPGARLGGGEERDRHRQEAEAGLQRTVVRARPA